MEEKYSKVTIEGDKKTEWICGCVQTADNYFKLCNAHNQTLQKAIQAQIDELDMTRVIEQIIKLKGLQQMQIQIQLQ